MDMPSHQRDTLALTWPVIIKYKHGGMGNALVITTAAGMPLPFITNSIIIVPTSQESNDRNNYCSGKSLSPGGTAVDFTKNTQCLEAAPCSNWFKDVIGEGALRTRQTTARRAASGEMRQTLDSCVPSGYGGMFVLDGVEFPALIWRDVHFGRG